MFKDSVPTSW